MCSDAEKSWPFLLSSIWLLLVGAAAPYRLLLVSMCVADTHTRTHRTDNIQSKYAQIKEHWQLQRPCRGRVLPTLAIFQGKDKRIDIFLWRLLLTTHKQILWPLEIADGVLHYPILLICCLFYMKQELLGSIKISSVSTTIWSSHPPPLQNVPWPKTILTRLWHT